MSLPSALMLVSLLWLGGCAKYEFIVLSPPELAGRLTQQERTLPHDIAALHLVDQNNRVGVRVENNSDGAITVVNGESYIVTPEGRSDAIGGGAIAPNSWAGFTIPPLTTVYERSGVSFGVGVGHWSHGHYGGLGVGYDPFYDDVYLPRSEVSWRWKTGVVKMHLVLQAVEDPEKRIVHDLVIERRKVDS